MPYVDRTVFTSNDQSSGQVADPNQLETRDAHIADIVDENYKELLDFVNGNNISKLGITNVKDYGAVGDGVTNDTESIQEAIDEGENVYFPSGSYVVGTLTLKDGLRLIGVDAKLILNEKITTSNLNNLTFEGLDFEANATMNETLYINTGSNILIENCTFSGGNHYGVTLRRVQELSLIKNDFGTNGSSAFGDAGLKLNGKNVSVDSCHFLNNPNGGGVYLHSDSDFVCDGVVFSNCFSIGNYLHGFLTHHGGDVSWKVNNVKFVNCISNDNGYDQVNSGFAIHYADGVDLVSCTANSNNEHGITLMDSENVIVDNPTTIGNGCSGVRLQADWNRVEDQYSGVKNSKIINGINQGNGTLNTSTDISNGVLIEGNCHYIEVKDNVIKDNNGGSIRVKERSGYTDCSNIFADNNIIRGTSSGDEIIWDSTTEKSGYGRNFITDSFHSIFTSKVVDPAGSATLTIGKDLDLINFYTTTDNTSVTTISDGWEGRELKIICTQSSDLTTSFDSGGNIKLGAGTSTISLSNGDILYFIYFNNNWNLITYKNL